MTTAPAAKISQADVRTIGERSTRDLPKTVRTLERWLSERMPAAKDVAIADIAYPQGAGMSNETILLRAGWREDGKDVRQGLVVRVEPNIHALFMDASLRRQFDVLKALHATGQVRIAEPLWYEEDASVLGAPFYMMRRLEGRVPVSFPPYNREGFVFDASVADREILWRTAVEELARIARTPTGTLDMLAMPDKGETGFDQHFRWGLDYMRWSKGETTPFIQEAEAWLLKHRPKAPPSGLSWGDARIGNMMFGADFRLAGVMDWEQASLGGPLHDLGWWLFFDDIHARHQKLARLEGLGNRQQTVELWQDLTGLSAEGVEWYEVFAGYKLSGIGARNFGQYRKEQPGHNHNNNNFTRAMAEIMGVDAPVDIVRD